MSRADRICARNKLEKGTGVRKGGRIVQKSNRIKRLNSYQKFMSFLFPESKQGANKIAEGGDNVSITE